MFMTQTEMRLLGDAKRQPREINLTWVQQCENLDQAIRMCWELRGTRYTQAKAAELLEIDPGYLSRCLNEKGNFPPSKIDALMDLCQNEIPLIWQAWRRGKQIGPTNMMRRESDQGGRRGQFIERRMSA